MPSNWSLALSAKVGPAPTWLPSGVQLSGSTNGLVGTVADSAGSVTFDLKASLTGQWSVGSVATINSLQAEISNAAPPTSCVDSSGNPLIGSGNLWLDIGGSATLNLPGAATPGQLLVGSCFDVSTGHFVLTTTASLSHWKPIGALPISLDSASLTIASLGSGPSVAFVGNLTAFGCPGTVTVAVPAGAAGVFVSADIADLGCTGISPLSGVNGALVFSTVAIPDLSTIPGLNIGIPAAQLHGVSLGANAFDAFGDIDLGSLAPGVPQFLHKNLSLPTITDLVVQVDLGASIPTIKAIASLGTGVTLFQTSSIGVKLAALDFELSLSGSIGIGATATLSDNAVPTATGSGHTTGALTLHAELTLSVAPPTITAAFYTVGEIDNAFGITGLDLGNLAVQGSIDFTGVATPSIGFGATILGLPTALGQCGWHPGRRAGPYRADLPRAQHLGREPDLRAADRRARRPQRVAVGNRGRRRRRVADRRAPGRDGRSVHIPDRVQPPVRRDDHRRPRCDIGDGQCPERHDAGPSRRRHRPSRSADRPTHHARRVDLEVGPARDLQRWRDARRRDPDSDREHGGRHEHDASNSR